MGDPDNGGNSPFNGKPSTSDDVGEYHHPVFVVTADILIQREQDHTNAVDIDWDGSAPELEYHVEGIEQTFGMNDVVYTLNCLLEYNNQTVLVDSSRNKPLHFANHILPRN